MILKKIVLSILITIIATQNIQAFDIKKVHKDKRYHFETSLALTYPIWYFVNKNKNYSELKKMGITIGLTMGIGLGKELYDEYDYKGFSDKDLMADFTGAVIGALLSKEINAIITIKKNHKKTEISVEKKVNFNN